jgi:hypothetical protein
MDLDFSYDRVDLLDLLTLFVMNVIRRYITCIIDNCTT